MSIRIRLAALQRREDFIAELIHVRAVSCAGASQCGSNRGRDQFYYADRCFLKSVPQGHGIAVNRGFACAVDWRENLRNKRATEVTFTSKPGRSCFSKPGTNKWFRCTGSESNVSTSAWCSGHEAAARETRR